MHGINLPLLIRLIEKALLKIEWISLQLNRSSVSILNYRICGWVPEEIAFKEIPNKDNLWARLYANYIEGNILLSLSDDKK